MRFAGAGAGLALMLAALVPGVLQTPAGKAGEPAPAALSDGVASLHDKVVKLRAEYNDGKLKGAELKQQILELEDAKTRLFPLYPAIFGIPASVVLGDVDEITRSLSHLTIAAVLPRAIASRDSLVRDLEDARRAKQDLEKRLHEAKDVPDRLLEGLVTMDRRLGDMIDEVDAGKLSGSALGDRVRTLQELQRGLLAFFPKLYDVPAATAIGDLDEIDRQLTTAWVIGVLPVVPHVFDVRSSVDDSLRGAVEMTKSLADRLRPPQQPRRGPACAAGRWQSAALTITTPAAARTSEYYFTTPVPNAAYYDLTHGYVGGGCDHTLGKVKINAAVLDGNGKAVSWYYDAPPYPLDPHENKPIKVYEGESCDVTITNPDGTTTVEHHCRIQLVDNAGVPLPRENFYSLKPASTLANLYPQYAVVIAVVNINGNRPEGGEKATFTVHVSWRPA